MFRYNIDSAEGNLLFAYKQKEMEAGFRDDVHSYDELKFVRVVQGGAIWKIGGQTYTVQAGDILVFSRADLRRVQRVTEAPFVIEQVLFAPAFLAPIQEIASFFVRRSATFSNLLVGGAAIAPYMNALVEEVRAERPFKRQAVRSKLTELVIATARLFSAPSTEESQGDRGQTMVAEAMAYVCSHFQEDLTLADVAGHFFLSVSYFSRLFRAHSGMAFTEYLARVRVREVLALLAEGKNNVLQAALACGFRSSSGFYRTFHHVTGATPKQFLRG